MAVPDRLTPAVLIAGLAAAAAGTSLAGPAVLAAQALHPQWSPDGSWIAYYERTDDSAIAFTVHLEPPVLHRTLTSGPGYAANPTWSPNGRIAIAFAPDGMRGTWDVYVLEPRSDGDVILHPEPRRITDTPEREMHTSWSPTSDWIAFVRLTDVGSDVYAVRPDGSEERQLTFTAEREFHPKWAPDGQSIAFDSGGDDRRDIYVLEVATNETRLVTSMSDGEFASTPAWSPDGERLAFSLGRESAELYVINADGTGQRQLTALGGHNGAPFYSPDGASIAFHSDHQGEWGIYVMTLDAGPEEQPRKISR